MEHQFVTIMSLIIIRQELVGPDHQYAEKTMIMKGRYVNELDVKNKSKHAVIGRLVAQDLSSKKTPLENSLI